MTYSITCLRSLVKPMLDPILADLPVKITSESTEHGFTTLAIECDATTAAKIDAAGFEVVAI